MKTWSAGARPGATQAPPVTKESGEPLKPQTVSRSFKRALIEAKLPGIRLHGLRHAHATLALEENFHPKVVGEGLRARRSLAPEAAWPRRSWSRPSRRRDRGQVRRNLERRAESSHIGPTSMTGSS